MAITAASLTSGSDETDATSYATASITPTANHLVLAAIAVESAGAQEIPTLSGCSLTWVQVGTIDGGVATQRLTVFRALGASPTTGVLTVAISATQVRCKWSVVEFADIDTSGTDGSGAVVQFKAATGTGTAGAADFDAAFGDAVNNATYSALFTGVSVGGITPDTNYTELHEVSLTGLLETMWILGEDQTPAPTWGTSRLWTQVVVEIKATGAATQNLTGTLFTKAPTFPTGVLTLGAAPTPPSPSTGGNRMGGTGAIRKPPRTGR